MTQYEIIVCSNDDLNASSRCTAVAPGERGDAVAVAKEYYISLKSQVKRMHYHNKTCVLICNHKAVSVVKINKNIVQIVLTKTVFSVYSYNNIRPSCAIIYREGK